MFTSHDIVCIRYQCLGKSHAVSSRTDYPNVWQHPTPMIIYQSTIKDQRQCFKISLEWIEMFLTFYVHIFFMKIIDRRNNYELLIISMTLCLRLSNLIFRCVLKIFDKKKTSSKINWNFNIEKVLSVQLIVPYTWDNQLISISCFELMNLFSQRRQFYSVFINDN